MALAFDWYSSDGTENMVNLYEEFPELPSGSSGKKSTGWKIVSSVNAVDKLVKYNKEVRMSDKSAKQKTLAKPRTKGTPKLATTTFIAPSVISLGRRDNITAPASFLTGFWICPTGTGKSRFMSAAISKSPISVPRWLVHMNLNNFLDQDTFLLLGQHKAVLQKEAEGYLAERDSTGGASSNVRKSTYVYKSPSERMGVRIGRFFDATLSRVPNRKEALLSWYNRNSNDNRLFEEWPSREVVLDRFRQHTQVCPDSMGVVRNCDKVIRFSTFVGAALLFLRLVFRNSLLPLLQESVPFALPTTLFAAKQLLAQFLAKIISYRAVQMLTSTNFFYMTLGLAALSHWVASRIKREFFFKFDDALHRRDIKYIAKNWVDL
jgi:hypothetical protein